MKKQLIAIIGSVAVVGAIAGAAAADSLADPAALFTPPQAAQRVKSGESDILAGIPEYYFVPVEAAVSRPAPVFVRVKMGESDILAGMPRFILVPVEPVNSLDIEALYLKLGETDILAGMVPEPAYVPFSFLGLDKVGETDAMSH